MKLHYVTSGLMICCAVVLAGCGEDNGLVPVRGRVLLDDQPVEGAAVMFQPDQGVPATATTDAKGEFEMSTPQGKGAAVGMNKISVSKQVAANPNRKTEESEIVAMKSLTPPKYASPQTSGLSAEVKRGMEPVELKLSSK